MFAILCAHVFNVQSEAFELLMNFWNNIVDMLTLEFATTARGNISFESRAGTLISSSRFPCAYVFLSLSASTHLNQLFEGDYPKLVRLFTYLPEYIQRQLTPSSQQSTTVTTSNTYATGGGSDKGKEEFSQ